MLLKTSRFLAPVALLVATACGQGEQEAAAPQLERVPRPESFVRLLRFGEDAGRLEAAVVRYQRGDGTVLDLIGVLHLADATYWDQLQRSFEHYDAVLYEMIQPEGADPSRRAGGTSPVGMLQKAMCRVLQLEFQLEAVDYGRENFVHADLTTEGFAERWEARDESIWKMVMKLMSAQGKMNQEAREAAESGAGGELAKLTPAALLDLVRSKDRSTRLKLLMAEVFSRPDMLGGLTESDEEGRDTTLLIGDRNKAALKILEREVAGGRKQLALLYGAGHCDDFDARLTKDLGFTRTRVTWVPAWTVGEQPEADDTGDSAGKGDGALAVPPKPGTAHPEPGKGR